MGKQLKISLATGRVRVEGVPAEDASDEQKNDRTLAVVEEIRAELPEVEKLVEESQREAILRLWVLKTHLEAHPVRWIRNYALRAKWNEVNKQIDGLYQRAAAELPDDVGKQMWEDLPYAREALGLLFDKLRAQGEVQRLILSPLGKLAFAKIKYQREGPEDLTRVAREIEEVVRASAKVDDDVRVWGDQNIPSLLSDEPPRALPASLAPAPTPGFATAGVGALVAGAGVVLQSPLNFAAFGAGALVLAGGVALAAKALKRRGELPGEFKDLGARYRERLYLVCCLRGLYQMTSRLTRATDAFDRFVKENGGVNRWKRVKTEEKEVTKVFAEGSEGWHPKETIETWLSDQVTKTYRLDSQSLAAPADIDAEAWDAIARAYKLSSDELGGDGKLLDVVADLLFIRRGENIEAERRRVFGEIHAAWDKALRDRATR